MSASKKIANRKDIAKALIGAVVVLLVIDLTPFGGNTFFYMNWLLCGHQPVQSGTTVSGEVNHYIATKKFNVLRGLPTYFCSPEDAEKAGYSADPRMYRFPHLPASEFQQAVRKSRQIGQ